jgi:hypothetical protein
MTDPADAFRYDDAAYVLGALDDADRAAFEAHLETCADCRARVAEAREAAGLLAGVRMGSVEDSTPMPDTLLPGLLRSAGRERRHRRWLTTSLGAVAAASIAALVVLVWPTSHGASGPRAQAMSAVRPSPVTATAKLVSRGWGTEIDLQCRYSDKVERYEPYSLVVVDDVGNHYSAGSWLLAPGRQISFTGGTAVQLQDIASVEITRQDGTPILQLNT